MTGQIQTKRLEIKPFSQADREPLSVILLNEEIKKTYMIPDFDNTEALDKMLERFMELSALSEHFMRGIYSQNKLIGFVNDVEIVNDCIELGYVIHPAYWGNGYATEMLEAVITELLTGKFSTVKTGAFAENTASIRVMEKCGMKRCKQTEVLTYRGAGHECVYYEIEKKE